MRILFITSTRIGDAVLSTGLLRHLLQRHPEARVTIACGPLAAGVFARMPGRERTIVMEKRRFDLHWVALWAEAVRRRWDLVVDLRGSATAFLLPARRRAVMRGGRRPGHRARYLAGLLGLGTPPLPRVWFSEDDRARATAFLPAGAPYLVLAPTANWPDKMWPAARFAALAQALRPDLPGLLPVVLAGPGEAERARAAPLLAALPGAVDLVGRLALPEAAAVLMRCVLFVGNDSGLMHLAAAAGTPTLGLFGPTVAREYGPTGPRAAAAMAAGPEGGAPMAALSVEAVLRAALCLVEHPAGGSRAA
jgi:ADP-heptose:LPS heptosyltransferase